MSGWLVFGASVRGPDHEREQLPCQDAWASSDAPQRAALCLCDGAGSARHAEVGARVVASAVIEALREAAEVDETTMQAACAAGRAALLREAAALDSAPAALACTVLAVALSGTRVTIGHIGDGVVVGRRAGSGELVVLSGPDRGEYVNETWFITSASWAARLRVTVHEDIAALCAVTDGCQEACLVRGPAPTPFGPFFAPIFAFAAEVEEPEVAAVEVAQLLAGAALRASSGDDKTLVVARRRASR